MADSWNDGNLPDGSRILTISGVTFIAENFDYTEPTGVSIERLTELGAPGSQTHKKGFPQGTATLQLATTATVVPEFGLEFTTTIRGASVTFGIIEVGAPEANDAAKMVNITFRRKINA